MDYTKELEEKVNKAISILATVDFYSKVPSTINSNQSKVHKAYDLLFEARDIIKYSLGGTNEIKQR